jgi:ubiquinone/menaquinone biosynthesis C-methylase UbiE
MSEGKIEAKETTRIRAQEEARTSHWFYSRRGPAFLSSLFRLGDASLQRVRPYIHKGQVVADLGCGWGYFSFALANLVGPEGKVYAVDLGKNNIQSIRKKINKGDQHNIEAYCSSASDLNFINDRTIDFVFANGLLCSMAYFRPLAVSEIQRILKESGKAYISLGMTPPFGYVGKAEWDQIMEGFVVEQGGSFKDMWAVVSLKPDGA